MHRPLEIAGSGHARAGDGISPFAKGGVDSTVYDTTAILALIEKWWDLPALGGRDAAQADLAVNAMNFGE